MGTTSPRYYSTVTLRGAGLMPYVYWHPSFGEAAPG